MATVKLTIEYDGSRYAGFQSQQNAPAVQDCLEAVLRSISGVEVRVRASGRTDSGVHAEGQVVAFEYDGPLSIDRLKGALNARLPDDVSVLAATESKSGFDPRREASARVYEYRILNRPARSALHHGRTHWVPQPLNLNRMRQAAELLVGRHDFRQYSSAESGEVPRHVFNCVCWREGDMVFIRVRANAFARRMVRRIAGALLQVGLGRWHPQVVGELLSEVPSTFVSPSLPAHGLYLTGVEYGRRPDLDNNEREQPVRTMIGKNAD